MSIGDIMGGIGSLVGAVGDIYSANKNVHLQKQFAQTGIQWKVADAKKAGIHPLYALGAQTHSFAPVQTGLSDSLGNAGQSIGRAVDAYSDKSQRNDAFTKASQSLQLDGFKLDNDLKRAQLASAAATLNQAGQPPAPPTASNRYLMPGQGSTQTGLVDTQPLRVSSVDPNAKHNEAGAFGEVGWARTSTGLAPVQSKDSKDRTEEDLPALMGWTIRNRLMPMVNTRGLTPPVKPKAGHYWRWDAFRQEYQETPIVRTRATPFGWRQGSW